MHAESENHIIIIQTILFVFICFVMLLGRLPWAFMLFLVAKKNYEKKNSEGNRKGYFSCSTKQYIRYSVQMDNLSGGDLEQ